MTDEEIFFSDYKDYALVSRQREMVFTVVLNKTANYTDILYQGEGAKEAAEAAFGPSDATISGAKGNCLARTTSSRP